jgi:hypothetical protein
MKPTHSILSNSFRYVPAMATSVSDTWSRFGWRPTSQERRQRVVEEASRREVAVGIRLGDDAAARHFP